MNQLIEMINDEKEDFSDGDLILIIACIKCHEKFEINPLSISMAMMTNASIWDYIKYVQHSKCSVCNPNKDEKVF